MKKEILLWAIGLMLFLPTQAQKINAETSKVTFEIGNMAFRVVEGSFTEMSGEIRFNATDLSSASFKVCINPETVDTDNKKRDDHLKNEDFFHTSKYPSICFESTTIKKGENGFIAVGQLTMHGVTKEVQIPFTYEKNTFTGTLNLNRLDYQIGEDTSTFMVADEVSITITCQVN